VLRWRMFGHALEYIAEERSCGRVLGSRPGRK
jgi:hypothetical protein